MRAHMLALTLAERLFTLPTATALPDSINTPWSFCACCALDNDATTVHFHAKDPGNSTYLDTAPFFHAKNPGNSTYLDTAPTPTTTRTPTPIPTPAVNLNGAQDDMRDLGNEQTSVACLPRTVASTCARVFGVACIVAALNNRA